jgi:hypothetical protein
MRSSSEALERWRQQDVAAVYSKGRYAGALATASWLSSRGLLVPPRKPWEVSIAIDVVDERAPSVFSEDKDTRFHIAIGSGEWGFFFCHYGLASWIRVIDVPFVHERDEFNLLARVPPLRGLGSLMRTLEEKYRFRFRREHAAIRSTISSSEPAIWEWVLADL